MNCQEIDFTQWYYRESWGTGGRGCYNFEIKEMHSDTTDIYKKAINGDELWKNE